MTSAIQTAGPAGGVRAAPQFPGSHAAETNLLKDLLLYEDSATGVRAKKIMNGLDEGGDGGTNSKTVLFRFEFLARRDLWEPAAQTCQRVDVLVISAHAAASVPVEIKSWLVCLLGLKGEHPRTIIVSFDSALHQTADAGQTVFFLHSLAQSAGLRLKMVFGDGPHAELETVLNRRRTNNNSARMNDLHPRNPAHQTRRPLGLNE